jgi:glucose-6-phosphate-specific signal transduction histidine kinase
MQAASTFTILLAVTILLFTIACRNEEKSTNHDTERLASIYAQLLLLHERLRTQPPQLDSLEYRRRLQYLLDSTNYTEERLTRDIERELRTIDDARRFYDRVAALLEQQRHNP